MIEEETARAGIFDEVIEENLQKSFENVKTEEGVEDGILWGVGDAEQVKIMTEHREAEKCLLEKHQKDQDRISRRKILLEQVEQEKLMAEQVKQKAIEDEQLKRERRIELKRKRYLDKINDQSKIAELDVFKPSLNIGAMRIEDKVAMFFQSSQNNDDAITEFTQDSGLATSGFGTTEHENFSLQEEASDYDEIAKAIDPHGKTSRAKLKLIRQVHATVTQRLWDDVTKAIEQMESHNAILPFNIIDSYSNLKKRIEDKNDENKEGTKIGGGMSETGGKHHHHHLHAMTPDNIQQGEVLEPEAEELLPKHWKLAYDNSGKRYYYHELSRKSQWDVPVEIIPEEIKILEKSEKMSKFKKFQQPVNQNKITKSISTAEPHDATDQKSFSHKSTKTRLEIKPGNHHSSPQTDNSTSQHKKPTQGLRSQKYKEKIERLVRRILVQFTKEAAMVGRITCDTDLEYLAKRWTKKIFNERFRLACYKEAKLSFPVDVAKNHGIEIEKYMSKQGPIFVPKKSRGKEGRQADG